MTDQTLYDIWKWSLIGGGVIVLVAASLLITVWLAARRIRARAAAALETVREIKVNTASVWALEDTNQVAGDLLHEARSILNHAGGVASALQAGRAGR